MIRYVIAVVLTIAILGISLPAIDDVAGDKSESELRTIATTIEDQADELQRVEEPPPRGVRGPQRVFDVSFPGDGLTSKPVAQFELIPRPDDNVTVLLFRAEGRDQRTVVIDTVIVGEDGGSVDLGQPSGHETYRLRLARDADNEPIVVFSRDVVNEPGEDWGPD